MVSSCLVIPRFGAGGIETWWKRGSSQLYTQGWLVCLVKTCSLEPFAKDWLALGGPESPWPACLWRCQNIIKYRKENSWWMHSRQITRMLWVIMEEPQEDVQNENRYNWQRQDTKTMKVLGPWPPGNTHSKTGTCSSRGWTDYSRKQAMPHVYRRKGRLCFDTMRYFDMKMTAVMSGRRMRPLLHQKLRTHIWGVEVVNQRCHFHCVPHSAACSYNIEHSTELLASYVW